MRETFTVLVKDQQGDVTDVADFDCAYEAGRCWITLSIIAKPGVVVGVAVNCGNDRAEEFWGRGALDYLDCVAGRK